MSRVKVKLDVNLGWQDADRFGLGELDQRDLCEGCTVTLSDEHAKVFAARHWGTVIEAPKAKELATK